MSSALECKRCGYALDFKMIWRCPMCEGWLDLKAEEKPEEKSGEEAGE